MKISSNNNRVISSIIFFFTVFTLNVGETSDSKHNAPEEIIDLFTDKNTRVLRNKTIPRGVTLNENRIFAEGTIINVTSSEMTSSVKHAERLHPVEAVTEKNKTAGSSNETQQLNETANKVTKKLSEPLDFISGMSDSSHANGASSIKPRKGVNYNRIVPKKGVIFEDFSNDSLPFGQSCFFMNENTCYDVSNFKDNNCTCCNISNKLGALISRQPVINCSLCMLVNTPNDFVQPCQGICCQNVTVEVTVGKNISNSSKIDPISKIHQNKLVTVSINENNHVKTKKLKPTVTNVPYDSDGSNPFSKSKGEKYVPIIVSIFILPLAGVFIFFLWKKTRELWDRRYYKRMDFLIDGMYND